MGHFFSHFLPKYLHENDKDCLGRITFMLVIFFFLEDVFSIHLESLCYKLEICTGSIMSLSLCMCVYTRVYMFTFLLIRTCK
jgi:hypothetical protein